MFDTIPKVPERPGNAEVSPFHSPIDSVDELKEIIQSALQATMETKSDLVLIKLGDPIMADKFVSFEDIMDEKRYFVALPSYVIQSQEDAYDIVRLLGFVPEQKNIIEGNIVHNDGALTLYGYHPYYREAVEGSCKQAIEGAYPEIQVRSVPHAMINDVDEKVNEHKRALGDEFLVSFFEKVRDTEGVRLGLDLIMGPWFINEDTAYMIYRSYDGGTLSFDTVYIMSNTSDTPIPLITTTHRINQLSIEETTEGNLAVEFDFGGKNYYNEFSTTTVHQKGFQRIYVDCTNDELTQRDRYTKQKNQYFPCSNFTI